MENFHWFVCLLVGKEKHGKQRKVLKVHGWSFGTLHNRLKLNGNWVADRSRFSCHGSSLDAIESGTTWIIAGLALGCDLVCTTVKPQASHTQATSKSNWGHKQVTLRSWSKVALTPSTHCQPRVGTFDGFKFPFPLPLTACVYPYLSLSFFLFGRGWNKFE
jgi:hypothetical protein